MNKNFYLLNDDSEVTLSKKEELEEYLRFRNDNDILINCYVNEMSAAGIENIPLFAQQFLNEMEASYKGLKMPCEKLSYDNKEVRECIDQTGLFLIVPYENKNQPVPTSEYAVGTILQRADDFCGTMSRFYVTKQSCKKVLPVSEKAVRLTRDFELYEEKCLVLIRDGKVRAVHSRLYDWLDNEKLINILEENLKNDHPQFCFKTAKVCHEFLSVDYELNNELIEESIKMNLNDRGSNIRTVKSGVRFVTSDVGMSAVKCFIILDIDENVIVLSGLSMEHKNGASEEKFKELLQKDFGNILKESEDRIEELGNTDIMDIPFVVKEITEHNNSIFPSKVSEEMVDELKLRFPVTVGGTAIDVFIALNEIISRHANSNKLSMQRYLMLTEQVSGLINLPFDKIEAGEFYKK